jgi:leucyl aminopeptidase
MKCTLQKATPKSNYLHVYLHDKEFYNKTQNSTLSLIKRRGKADRLNAVAVTDQKGDDIMGICLSDKDHEITTETIRRAAALAVQKAKGLNLASVYFDTQRISYDTDTTITAITEGAIMGRYEFKKKSKTKKPTLKNTIIGITPTAKRKKLLKAATIISKNTCFVRDLVNESTTNKSADQIIAKAKKIAKDSTYAKVKILRGQSRCSLR